MYRKRSRSLGRRSSGRSYAQGARRRMLLPTARPGPRGLATKKQYRKKGRTGRRRSKLSPCGQQYLKVQYNPFGPIIGEPPCIPDAVAAPSFKFTARQRFTVTTDAAGFGYVLMNPYNFVDDSAVDPTYATQSACLAYTNGTAPTVANSIDLTVDSAAKLSFAGLNTGYDATFVTNNKVRVVGAGVRMTYAGALQDAAGQVTVWKHPTNNKTFVYTATGATKLYASDLQTFDEAAYGALSANTSYMATYHPIDIDDFDYQAAPPGPNACGYVMAIVIEGCPSKSFTCEAIVHYEGIGVGFHGLATSTVDLWAFGQVARLPRAQLLNTTGPQAESYFSQFMNWARR